MSEEKEQAILDSVDRLPKGSVVLVGGYAVNAYVPPRFSDDCDLVVLKDPEKIEKELEHQGFERVEAGDVPYGHYVRYESKPSGVTYDLLVGSLVDNRTGVAFSASLFREYSAERRVIGRIAVKIVTLRVADPELLFATKFAPARRSDVRDMFMLSGTEIDWDTTERLIRDTCSESLIELKVAEIMRIIDTKRFQDSLQSAFGKIPDARLARCKKSLDSFLSRLRQSKPARRTKRG